jgi:hypothetical protein
MARPVVPAITVSDFVMGKLSNFDAYLEKNVYHLASTSTVNPYKALLKSASFLDVKAFILSTVKPHESNLDAYIDNFIVGSGVDTKDVPPLVKFQIKRYLMCFLDVL